MNPIVVFADIVKDNKTIGHLYIEPDTGNKQHLLNYEGHEAAKCLLEKLSKRGSAIGKKED